MDKYCRSVGAMDTDFRRYDKEKTGCLLGYIAIYVLYKSIEDRRFHLVEIVLVTLFLLATLLMLILAYRTLFEDRSKNKRLVPLAIGVDGEINRLLTGAAR